jgi:hypothetical protein
LETRSPDRHSGTVPTDAEEKSTPVRRVTAGRTVAVVILLGIALLWIYALTRQPEPPPDRLDDATYAVAAEQICSAAVQEIDRLPQAHDATTPTERAEIVAQSNIVLSSMLSSLERAAPPGERDRRMLDEWLGDWSVYLENRRDYVDRLRAEGDTRIYVAEKDGRQITVAVDRFAEVNDMLSCRTPKDIS